MMIEMRNCDKGGDQRRGGETEGFSPAASII